MSLFGSILEKIGIKKPAAPAAAPASPAANTDAVVNAAMAKAAEEAKARVAAQAKAAADAAAHAAASVAPAPSTVQSPTMAPASIPMPPPAPAAPVAPAAVAAVSMVDVVGKLEGLAKAHPGLDWKVSIVDLLKLLEIDSSFEARKELAVELGCPADMMNDSARMNVWLHKTVLQKIAENGGNIPAALLD